MPYKDKSKNREFQRKYQREWRKKNSDKWNDILRKSDIKRTNSPKRLLSRRSAHQRKHIRNKLAVFEMYGKECKWCGENRFELLSIDHINNDGSIHRKQMKGTNIYEWLVKQEYQPEKFQVLCFNCNTAKQMFGIKPNEVDYMPWEYWKEISKLKRSKQ